MYEDLPKRRKSCRRFSWRLVSQPCLLPLPHPLVAFLPEGQLFCSRLPSQLLIDSRRAAPFQSDAFRLTVRHVGSPQGWGVNVNMCIAVHHIDCIVFRNLLEMNDVPEIPAYDESNVNTIIYSSDDFAQLCGTIPTVAAQFQDAASTGASLIPVPGSPPYRTDRNLVSKPALPLASAISRYSYNPFRTCPRRRRSPPTSPVQSRSRCPACHAPGRPTLNSPAARPTPAEPHSQSRENDRKHLSTLANLS